MSALALQVALASAGLAIVVLGAAPVLAAWRHRPVGAYRIAFAAVVAGGLLLPAQLAAEALGAPAPGPLRALGARVARLVAETPREAPGTPGAVLLDERALLLALALDEGAALHGRQPARPAPARAAAAPPPRPLTALALLWLAGAAWRALRSCLRALGTARLVRDGEPVRDPRVLAAWNELVAEDPRRARVRLCRTPRVRVPACTGLLQRAILLPPGIEQRLDQPSLRCVLLHELVHLERRDALSLLAQELLGALFWFHPAAAWLARRLELLRELSCDHLVVARTRRPKQYAAALVECAAALGGARSRPSAAAALLPAAHSRTQLHERIEMLFTKQEAARARASWTSLAVAGSIACAVWGSQVALAAGMSAPFEEARAGASATPIARRAASAEEARLGALILPAGESAAAELGFAGEVLWRVEQVLEGSAAERGGLRKGDLILRIDGGAAPSLAEFRSAAARLAAGEAVSLRVVRGDRLVPLVLELAREARQDPAQREAHGLEVRQALTEALRRAFEEAGGAESRQALEGSLERLRIAAALLERADASELLTKRALIDAARALAKGRDIPARESLQDLGQNVMDDSADSGVAQEERAEMARRTVGQALRALEKAGDLAPGEALRSYLERIEERAAAEGAGAAIGETAQRALHEAARAYDKAGDLVPQEALRSYLEWLEKSKATEGAGAAIGETAQRALHEAARAYEKAGDLVPKEALEALRQLAPNGAGGAPGQALEEALRALAKAGDLAPRQALEALPPVDARELARRALEALDVRSPGKTPEGARDPSPVQGHAEQSVPRDPRRSAGGDADLDRVRARLDELRRELEERRQEVEDLRRRLEELGGARSGEWIYRVRPGDTLETISERFQGLGLTQDALREANRGRLEVPRRLAPGTELRIPEAPVAGQKVLDLREAH